MTILGLYSNSQIDSQKDIDVLRSSPDEPTEQDFPFVGLYGPAELIGRGAASGLASVGLLGVDAATVAAEGISDEWFGKDISSSTEQIRQSAYDAYKSIEPNPRATTVVGNTVYGVMAGLTQFTAGSLMGGPVGGAATMGLSTANTEAKRLRSEGVDPKTALLTAGVTGMITAGGAVVSPALPGSLTTRLLSGAGINIGLGATGRASNAEILRRNGYKEMAAQYDPLDVQAAFVEGVLGAAFGAMHMPMEGKAKPIVGEAIHAPESDIAASIKATEVAGESAISAKIPDIDQDHIDTALIINSHLQKTETAPGVPVDFTSASAHANAFDVAVRQLVAGEDVNLSGLLDDATFIPRDINPETINALNSALHDFGLVKLIEGYGAITREAVSVKASELSPNRIGEYEQLKTDYAIARDAFHTAIKEAEAIADRRITEQDYKISSLEEKIKTVPARKAKEMRKEIEGLIKDRDETRQKRRDEYIAPFREKMQAIDYKMRDMAPKISAIYREAENRLRAANEKTLFRPDDYIATGRRQKIDSLRMSDDSAAKYEMTPTERALPIVGERGDISTTMGDIGVKITEEYGNDRLFSDAIDILNAKPDMMIVDDDGNTISASDAIKQLEEEIGSIKEKTPLFEVAAKCFIGG